MADRLLEKCEKIRKAVSSIPGDQSRVYQALMFAMMHCDLDEDRMFACIEKSKGTIPRIGTIRDALDALSDVYNYKCRTNRIYLYVEYDKFMRGKFSWYEKKWGAFTGRDADAVGGDNT